MKREKRKEKKKKEKKRKKKKPTRSCEDCRYWAGPSFYDALNEKQTKPAKASFEYGLILV